MNEELDPTNDQIVEPSVPQEEMDAFIKSLEDNYGDNINLSTLMPQGAVTNGDDEEETDEEDEETTPDDDTTDSDEFVTINGNQVARSDLQRLFEFDQYLRNNADVAERVAEAVKPRTTQPVVSGQTPAPEADKVDEFKAPDPPDGLDMDDPRDKILWDTRVAAERTAWENRQELIKMQRQQIQEQTERNNRQAAADLETAITQFRGQFKALNDDDMNQIRNEAGQFVPALIQSLGPSPQVFYRAMEIAGYANAEFRARMNSEEPKHQTQRQRSETRKKKLGSISGSPNSAPKENTRPVYRNDRDMVQQFADALSEQGLGR